MFVRDRVMAELRGRADAFRAAAERSRSQLDRYQQALDDLGAVSESDLRARLQDDEWPGAEPTAELTERGVVVPFGVTWNTAQQAREWARDELLGATTAAVDGSQIPASKEYAVPVSLVQVAWYVNPHNSDRPYSKDVCDEVLTPDVTDAELEQYAFGEARLSQRRFALEMAVATRQVEALAGEERALVLIDGTLVLSFIHRMTPPAQNAYLHALLELLETSKRCRVPVVGYVDLSYARDLTSMLERAFALPEAGLVDAQLLSSLMEPFDRSAAFVCARGDVLPHYKLPSGDWSHDLCFTYLKIGPERLPARLDFPRWVLDDGLLDSVVDIVRGEIIVGSGYPYAIETADAAAVLTVEDRMAFFRAFHEFAGEAKLDLSLPGKSVSKRRRR